MTRVHRLAFPATIVAASAMLLTVVAVAASHWPQTVKPWVGDAVRVSVGIPPAPGARVWQWDDHLVQLFVPPHCLLVWLALLAAVGCSIAARRAPRPLAQPDDDVVFVRANRGTGWHAAAVGWWCLAGFVLAVGWPAAIMTNFNYIGTPLPPPTWPGNPMDVLEGIVGSVVLPRGTLLVALGATAFVTRSSFRASGSTARWWLFAVAVALADCVAFTFAIVVAIVANTH